MSSGYLITDRRRIPTIPQLDVKDPDLAMELAEMPMSKVDSRVEPYTPEPETAEVVYDMKQLKLHWGEFLKHHSLAADSTGFMKQFKLLLPGVVNKASLLVMGDTPVATFGRDTKLALKKLEEEQPQVVAKYTRMVTKPEFDEATFRKEMPDVHAAYRGRSLRLKTAGSGAGLILPS